MIKFFRKIRQQLLTENKLGKYLLYAVGEIVLVVIGILIALSLNNWNQKQKEIKTETLSLNNLVSDLGEQVAILDDYIQYESTYTENGINVLKHYAKHKAFKNVGGILSKLNSLTSRRSFNPINATFEELKSTGNIGLIRNEVIKKNIIRYYNELEKLSLIVSNNNINLIDGITNPVIIKQTIFTSASTNSDLSEINDSIFDSESFKELRSTSEKILSNPENALNLFNVIELRTLIASRHKQLYEQIKQEAITLINEINTALENQ